MTTNMTNMIIFKFLDNHVSRSATLTMSKSLSLIGKSTSCNAKFGLLDIFHPSLVGVIHSTLHT